MNSLLRSDRGSRGFFRGFSGWLFRVALAVLVGMLPASPRKPRTLAHFYFVNDPSSRQSLEANMAQISLVSPQWFAVDQTGRLTSRSDNTLLDWAKQNRLPLMPLLINEKFKPEVAHAVLSDEGTQLRVVDQILNAALTDHFYGIQVDFENIPPDDREAFSRFVERLSKEFHKQHMKLSVAVPAPLAPTTPPSPRTSPWVTTKLSQAFDYRKLGKLADSVTLMAYDEHSSSDPPGPVAGLPWVEACLQQTLKYVPRKKTFLGIPLYYRQWNGKVVSEGTYGDALKLATMWGAKIEMDAEQREKTFHFEEGQDSHVVWLQDAESLRERVALVKKYGLPGFSAWRLGQEDPAAWNGAFSSGLGKR